MVYNEVDLNDSMEVDKKNFFLVLFVSSIVGLMVSYKTVLVKQLTQQSPVDSVPIPRTQSMTITSTEFDNEGIMPVTFTCNGENKNPPLSIRNVPETTKSLALIVEDPDAPLGPFVHWIMWNISPETKDILKGGIPQDGQQGTNSFNHTAYDGPCPPSRHRYFFTLYALDQDIGLDGKAKKSDLEKAMSGHIIEKAQTIGLYGN